MNIGIIGTRGIPNQYGGFEQFAEDFAVRMAARGHTLSVYTSHRHPYQERQFRNVRLIHCYDPEHKIGTAGQFIYDLNCIRDSRRRNFDIILQLGYTSSTVWSWLYPKQPLLVTNMDGLEWSRSKYGRMTRYFLTHAERWGVKYSDFLIADSQGIQEYLKKKYNAESSFVAYGAEVYQPEGASEVPAQYGLQPGAYDLAIARFEPENNMETILKAYKRSERPLLMVGDYRRNAFGTQLYEQYRNCTNIVFSGAIYNKEQLNALRYHSRIYLHGHSVGGTNPSLLEAMGCSALICAHENPFNKSVLGDAAFYFKDEVSLQQITDQPVSKLVYEDWIGLNRSRVQSQYNWDHITQQLETHFVQWLAARP